ncbi:MAG: hypothetical protein ACUVTX_06685 [Bacteroidales bacterium]
MKKAILIFTIVLFAMNCKHCQSARQPDKKSEIMVYPASEGSPVSNDYMCSVNGKDVAVYTA